MNQLVSQEIGQTVTHLVSWSISHGPLEETVNKSINPLKWYHVDCRTILTIKSRTWHFTTIVAQLVQRRSCLLHEDTLPFASFKI